MFLIMEKIPVSIITGFLGSGKTTLLSRLLNTDELQNAGLIINEFGGTLCYVIGFPLIVYENSTQALLYRVVVLVFLICFL